MPMRIIVAGNLVIIAESVEKLCLVINTISLESHLNKKGLRINMKRRLKPCLAVSV